MNDISNLYPKVMIDYQSDINKYDIDKLYELRKLLGNHVSFSLYGICLEHEHDKVEHVSKKYSYIELPEEEDK